MGKTSALKRVPLPSPLGVQDRGCVKPKPLRRLRTPARAVTPVTVGTAVVATPLPRHSRCRTPRAATVQGKSSLQSTPKTNLSSGKFSEKKVWPAKQSGDTTVPPLCPTVSEPMTGVIVSSPPQTSSKRESPSYTLKTKRTFSDIDEAEASGSRPPESSPKIPSNSSSSLSSDEDPSTIHLSNRRRLNGSEPPEDPSGVRPDVLVLAQDNAYWNFAALAGKILSMAKNTTERDHPNRAAEMSFLFLDLAAELPDDIALSCLGDAIMAATKDCPGHQGIQGLAQAIGSLVEEAESVMDIPLAQTASGSLGVLVMLEGLKKRVRPTSPWDDYGEVAREVEAMGGSDRVTNQQIRDMARSFCNKVIRAQRFPGFKSLANAIEWIARATPFAIGKRCMACALAMMTAYCSASKAAKVLKTAVTRLVKAHPGVVLVKDDGPIT